MSPQQEEDPRPSLVSPERPAAQGQAGRSSRVGALAYTPPLSREEVPPECALSQAGHPFIRHYVYLLP